MIAISKNYVISLSRRTSDADAIPAINTQTTAIGTPFDDPMLEWTKRGVCCYIEIIAIFGRDIRGKRTPL